ncbi:hypothetical protein, partial [Candidatus Electronema sp. TJ]|uniref:hypothetical protein n=1 Tax=Candidatus Electronema sp. TJ TaxID=3401573 RepID=UPI003AA94584
MSADQGNAPQEDKPKSSSILELIEPSSNKLAFYLVLIMLLILFGLIFLLLNTTAAHPDNKDFIEYSKWLFSGLITAFGAWIGAGAAYLFGKENLAESSRSTENALKIQYEAIRNTSKRDCVKDIALTTINKDFMFKRETSSKDVALALEQHADYWWVPVLDNEGKGILEDVLHARVFWRQSSLLAEDSPLSSLIEEISKDESLSRLHGSAFFIKAALDDKISDTIRKMDSAGAVIGIVVDDRGKPSYCFTKQNLLTAEQA